MIGSPISIGRVSEVVPAAPRPGVHAPLAMERILPLLSDAHLIEHINEIVALARVLPSSWQRLVSADFTPMEGQLVNERFVGVTVRDRAESSPSTCFAR